MKTDNLRIYLRLKMVASVPYTAPKAEVEAYTNASTAGRAWAKGKGIDPETVADVEGYKAYKSYGNHHVRGLVEVLIYNGVPDRPGDTRQSIVYDIVDDWLEAHNLMLDDVDDLRYDNLAMEETLYD